MDYQKKQQHFENRIVAKITKHRMTPHPPPHPKITFNATRPKVPYICWTTNHKSQI